MNMVAVFDEMMRRKPAASEWLAWASLMRQTVCFGKVEDDLADSRLEKLTGLRRDRARSAVRSVVDMDLFEAVGKGKYGTVYRVPQRFLGDDGYIGFSANMGMSETDAYAIIEDDAVTPSPEPEQPAYQELVETNRKLVNAYQELVETNRKLVNVNQELVETNRNLVNALPSLGEQLTKTRLKPYQELVTDINKPKHNITPTSLNPDSGEEASEHWPEHWGQAGMGGNDFQAWEQYAAMPDLSANQTPQPAKLMPTPPVEIASPVSRINAEALQYPEALTAEERVEAPKKLDGLHPQIAQEVLDALAWKIGSGTVRTPIGMLVHLANKAREGAFDRTPALEWRKLEEVKQAKQDKVTVTELNMLANEIKAWQAIQKVGGVENPMLSTQIETAKAAYFQKLDVYKAEQAARIVA